MPKRNEDFECEALHNAIDYLYLKLRNAGTLSKYTFNVNWQEIMCLSAHAFQYILNRKQSYHRGILAYFKKILKDNQLNNLNSIVDRKLSSVFDKIIF
ncbi:hypothetical protein C1646_766078 [Rhizophagus diaphanus]|nr:hypothetical protein C1646_766078 [Rhizophagus diaphanus] [Rhizophagus sp. MUCL 43196]